MMGNKCFNLLDNSQNVVLTDNDQFLAVDLDFGAGVLAGDYLIANLNLHNDFLTVNNTAGADSQDFCYLRLFLCGAGKNDAALGGLLCFGHLDDNAVR